MSWKQKEWNINDVYNFNVEFNRIESYNEYVENWLRNYYKYNFDYTFIHKTNWSINDIVDLTDYNRVKKNIIELLKAIDSKNTLYISYQSNQLWNKEKANEIEKSLSEILTYLGDLQFSSQKCGLAICGNKNEGKIIGGLKNGN